MRLHAYRDRFGDERFVVVDDGKLLTGAKLEKRGGLASGITHFGIGYFGTFEVDWLDAIRAGHPGVILGFAYHKHTGGEMSGGDLRSALEDAERAIESDW